MAFETKALLIAIAKIAAKAENAEEVYAAVAEMANSEGVILKPYAEAANESSKKDN